MYDAYIYVILKYYYRVLQKVDKFDGSLKLNGWTTKPCFDHYLILILFCLVIVYATLHNDM